MLYSINYSNFIDCLNFLRYLTAIVCFPSCHIIIFEIDLILLIKVFLYMTKKSRQKFKYFENEKSF